MIQSIDRAARIMNLLQGARRLGISELAAALELPPSTVHGLVKSLQAHGLVAQEPNGNRYVLGPALLKLSSVYLDTLDVRARSLRRMHELSQRTGLASHLGVLLGTDEAPIDINQLFGSTPPTLRAGSYAVRILGGSQGWLAQTFAVPGRSQAERFAQVLAKVALTGSPVLAEASAWLDCRLIEVVEVGTHGVFVARVVAAGSDNWHEEPLVYHQHAMFPLGEADQ